MGDGANDALCRAFDDEEEYYELKHRGATLAELYDYGYVDDHGCEHHPISTPAYIPAYLYVPKPKGPGPCPRCGSQTILRKNSHTGTLFFGCMQYPSCKGNRDADQDEML